MLRDDDDHHNKIISRPFEKIIREMRDLFIDDHLEREENDLLLKKSKRRLLMSCDILMGY